ncbi:phytoene/squalene synthase family protein [Halovulum dunhuangense]|uniref:Phytoene/squalene synthase family protein n=1 Tax=Halovulum dunhuangense TaxID=1505036 RepID=A0A849L066_9RHOB|nr:phytoene/squalene synthase family protein [Halovulum dunhuangense]NNU79340.1 phytoene/squalene synthase family protein [Halovulum dunhuangense]
MIAPADMEACRVAIRHGSKSFHAASRLLPARVAEPALALYAFCRLADDAVDLVDEKSAAVLRLKRRLDLAYAGTPADTAADRAFSQMVAATEMPRALPEALIEGFAWDAMGRRYDTLSEVRAYSARVASTVGAMMTVLMGVRDADALARACDLGVAMQLTNIARDVGEDAREGRLYLPMDWMREAGLDPDGFLADPRPSRPLALVVHRLLAEAQRLYYRAEAGIAALPAGCRPAIFAARHIYAAIGAEVRRNDYDSVTCRAHTGKARKLALVAKSYASTGVTLTMPRSAVLHAPPLPETAFLVTAAHRPAQRRGVFDIGERLTGLADILLELERVERARKRA